MATWDSYLQPASFDGVEFPLSSREISGGRAWAPRRYPNRPGQSGEDVGREPYMFELEIPLFHGVDPNHYPTLFEQLRAVFDDPQTTGEAEYVDPELGPLNAKVTQWRWITDAGRRDGGLLRVSIEEVTFDDQVLAVQTGDPQRDTESHAETLDSELDDFDLAEADLEEDFEENGVGLSEDEQDRQSGELWSTQVTRFVEEIEDGISDAEAVADRIDTIRTRIGLLGARSELQGPAGVHALHAAARLAESLGELGARAVIDAPPLVEHRIETSLSVYEVSSLLYGTPDRADEILQRNPSGSPLMIPAGTTLVVLAA